MNIIKLYKVDEKLYTFLHLLSDENEYNQSLFELYYNAHYINITWDKLAYIDMIPYVDNNTQFYFCRLSIPEPDSIIQYHLSLCYDRKSHDYDVFHLTKTQTLTNLNKLRPMVYLQNQLICVGF